MSHQRDGWAFKDFVLLFFIMMLAVIIVIFMNTIGSSEPPPTSRSASDEMIWQPSTIDNPGYVEDTLVKQNIELRTKLNKAKDDKEQCEKNASILAGIVERQDQLIKKMHERMSAYQEGAIEILSPSDWITNEQIRVYDNRVVIDVPFARAGGILDTDSEHPLLNNNSNTIEVSPRSLEDIHLGDIIVYYSTNSHELIVHRVVSQGIDDQGWFVITKGDNNFVPDDERIRYDQIKSIVVGIIY
jgi:hypothetical protein